MRRAVMDEQSEEGPGAWEPTCHIPPGWAWGGPCRCQRPGPWDRRMGPPPSLTEVS